MATSEPWEVGSRLPSIEPQSATTTALNSDIETLTAFKDTLADIPIKGVLESVIFILTLVKVSHFPFLFLHPLIIHTTRTRW